MSGTGRPDAAGVTVGHLATGSVLTAEPDWTLRRAAQVMHAHHVGSTVIQGPDQSLLGILTERDLLRAAGTNTDLDSTTVEQFMTTDVITAEPDWTVYEAASTMSHHGIRHLVVTTDNKVTGVLSIRDVLLSGQRVELTNGAWAVLRDPLTFTVRERRRLQRVLLDLGGGPLAQSEPAALIGELVGSWSFDLALPATAEMLEELDPADRSLLADAVLDEIPYLQLSVHPSPGWRDRAS
ncbi:MAG: CBS domain-containing protein [Euzebya sp.]